MKTIYICEDIFQPENVEVFQTENLLEFLTSKYEVFPEFAKLYNGKLADDHEVTPRNEKDIQRLSEMEGKFFLVCYPGAATTAVVSLVIAIVALAVVAIVAAYKKPSEEEVLKTRKSPNNELSNRSNKPRPLSRIPDIFGTVYSVPDLISEPYTVYENNTPIEYSLLCIGRGEYEVNENKVFEKDTLLKNVKESSIEVYPPFESVLTGTPQLVVGNPIIDIIFYATELESAKNQKIPNRYRGIYKIPSSEKSAFTFFSDGKIQVDTELIPDELTEEFLPGETVEIIDSTAIFFNSGIEYHNIKSQYVNTTTANITFTSGAVPSFIVSEGTLSLLSIKFRGLVKNPGTGEVTDYCTIDTVVTITSIDQPGGSIEVSLSNEEFLSLTEWQKTNGSDIYTSELNIVSSSSVGTFDGTYVIDSVSSDFIVLSSPELVNATWNQIIDPNGHKVYRCILRVDNEQASWIGPYDDASDSSNNLSPDHIYINVKAPSNLYLTNGTRQYAGEITFEVEISEKSSNGNLTGNSQIFEFSLSGSNSNKSSIFETFKIDNPYGDYFSIKIRKKYDIIFKSNSVFSKLSSDERKKYDRIEEVECLGIYIMSDIINSTFDNVTLVKSRSVGNSVSSFVRDRQLRMEVTRKIWKYNISGTPIAINEPTTRICDIVRHICLDPKIGNLKSSQIDSSNFFQEYEYARLSYYTIPGEKLSFSHTFDSSDVSFEEMLEIVAGAGFFTPYRYGSVIRLHFEGAREGASLLFNHRNKLPGSEKRTVKFGNIDDYDGVSLTFTSSVTDRPETINIPSDFEVGVPEAVKPRDIQLIGVRDAEQAYVHGYRIWNKIKYQNVHANFTCTQEANLLIPNDKIYVSDNTRTETLDGEIIAQEMLVLTLSQPYELLQDLQYTIFIQMTDGITDAYAVTALSQPGKVLLNSPTRIPLFIDPENYCYPTFHLSPEGDEQITTFIIDEKIQNDDFTYDIICTNYDERFYQNDNDIFQNS